MKEEEKLEKLQNIVHKWKNIKTQNINIEDFPSTNKTINSWLERRNTNSRKL
jgi:hypothetical protein